MDGSWCVDGQLIEVSETEARIRMTCPVAKDAEFFLLLTTFGEPVFRHCRRRWVNGALMGVSFRRYFLGAKPLVQHRDEAELA